MAAKVAASAAAPAMERLREEWLRPEVRARLREAFGAARPFGHAVLRPFLGEAALRAVRADVEAMEAVEKETDLFRFFQTLDLAPPPVAKRRRKAKAEPAAAPPTAMASLSKLFASECFRHLCAEITGCGELDDRVDLSSQVYARGGHLLCHDDVIGTRKISFIYYLTDPEEEWSVVEGGALELYPPDPEAPPGTPSACPTTELLPLSDSLALFVVEPGVSFHAVREVRGGRARMSIQGWLHAPSLDLTQGFERRSVATLQQLLAAKAPAVAPPRREAEAPAAPASLSAADRAVLSRWLSAEYLEGAPAAVSERFAKASYALLTAFLRADVAEEILGALAAADEADGFGRGEEPEVPRYDAGAAGGWTLVGPPHLRRYLRYAAGTDDSLGRPLQRLREELLSTEAFRQWLRLCTGLEPRSPRSAEIRRFRPGLDYTVAARAPTAEGDDYELDVTMMFVARGAEAAEQWASEEVGGFDSYLEADDERDESVEAQEVYRGSDEGPLVNLPATCNALALVMRDAKTLRFVKYLSRDAPSSRVDVIMSYGVDAPEGSSGEEGEGEGAVEAAADVHALESAPVS